MAFNPWLVSFVCGCSLRCTFQKNRRKVGLRSWSVLNWPVYHQSLQWETGLRCHSPTTRHFFTLKLTALKSGRATDEAASQPLITQSAKLSFALTNFKRTLLIFLPKATAGTWQHSSAFGVSAFLKFIRCRQGILSVKMRYLTKAFCSAWPTWACVPTRCLVQFHRIHRLSSLESIFVLIRYRMHRHRLRQPRSKDFYTAVGKPIFSAALKVFF